MTMTPDFKFVQPEFQIHTVSKSYERPPRMVNVFIGLCFWFAAFGIAIASSDGWAPEMMLLKTCFVGVFCLSGIAFCFSKQPR